MTNDKLIENVMSFVLLAALHLFSIVVGFLLAEGAYGLAVATEAIALITLLFAYDRSRPTVRYAWPPRRYLQEQKRDFEDRDHPCYKLLASCQAMLAYPSPANIDEVKRLLGLCREASPKDAMIATAETLLFTYRGDFDD